MTEILVACIFCFGLGYVAGRTDLRDLGPIRRKGRVITLDANTVARIQQARERKDASCS